MAENQQEAGSFQRPPATLTSKPLKQQQQQQVFKDTTNQTDSSPSGGYYFNVAQKGKLILPTALWILLVLAGVSFLTLLASLNRTVDTLDTLIEIEQERGFKHHWDHSSEHSNNNNNKRLGRHQNQADKLTGEVAHKQHQLESGRPLSSWLSLPSFSGFESPAANKEKELEAPEISGTFIIASSADGDTQPPAEMIDSMMSKVMQMLLPGSQPVRTKPSGAPRRESNPVQQSASGPLISANIEHLTVNLNGDGDDSNDDNGQTSRKAASNERQSQPGGGAEPIMSIMSQLIESKPLGMPAAPLVINLDDDAKPAGHEHKQAPVSSLSNLLLPFGSLPFVPLMDVPKLDQIRNPPRQQQQQQQQPLDDVIIIENKTPKFESLFALPESSGELASKLKLKQAGKQSSPYELPVGSPISALLDSMRDFDETKVALGEGGESAQSGLSKAKEQAKWDVLANDLADSFLSGAFQHKPSEPANPPESFLVLNGMPLDRGDHLTTSFLGQVFPEAAAPAQRPANLARPDSNTGDLFSVIFGSSSQMPAISGEQSNNSDTTPKPAESANLEPINLDEMVKTIQKELGESFVTPDATGGATGSQQPTSNPTKDAINELLISSITPDGATGPKSTSAPSTTKEDPNESALSDLFGTMFTMAQFGNEQQHQRPSSQAGGNSPSGSSTSSSSSSVVVKSSTPVVSLEGEQATTTTTTTETVNSSTTTTEMSVGEVTEAPSGGSTPPTSTTSPQQLSTAAGVESKPTSSLAEHGASLLNSLPGLEFLREFFTKEDRDSTPIPKTPSTPEVTTANSTASPESTTSVVSRSSGAETSTSQPGASTQSAPASTFAEVVAEDEPLLNSLPIIDLSPFAKKSASDADETKTSTTATPGTSPTLATTTGRTDTIRTDAAGASASTGKPSKSLLEKADDFIDRNLKHLRRLF